MSDLRDPLSDSAADEETGPPRSRTTLRDLLEALDLVEKPDGQFADDLEEIQAGQPLAGEFPGPPDLHSPEEDPL
jgi:hypothetical protein